MTAGQRVGSPGLHSAMPAREIGKIGGRFEASAVRLDSGRYAAGRPVSAAGDPQRRARFRYQWKSDGPHT